MGVPWNIDYNATVFLRTFLSFRCAVGLSKEDLEFTAFVKRNSINIPFTIKNRHLNTGDRLPKMRPY